MAVGTYEIRGHDKGWAFCSVPLDALPVVIAALEFGHSRRVLLTAEKPRYGKGQIFDFTIGFTEDEEEESCQDSP
jgi:hypothetical protein